MRCAFEPGLAVIYIALGMGGADGVASAVAQTGAMAWSASEAGEDEIKLGVARPGEMNYGGLWMSCRKKSGTVMIYMQLDRKALPVIAESVKANRGIELTLRSGKTDTITYPGLGFDQHDGIWQLEVRLDLADPVFAALAANGRIEARGNGLSLSFAGSGIARAWPVFSVPCKP